MNFELVKVCGMREAENIREVEQLFTLHASCFTPLMGFIFWPQSSRYVSDPPAYLPTKCRRVGVFVDEDIETIKRIAEDYALDFIQLHGHESPEYIRALRFQESDSRFQVIKAFNIATKEDIEATAPYAGLVDFFLFDTKGQSVGGNGEKFDWNILTYYDGSIPFLLSGGIGPDDAERVRAFQHPKCIGIDLNSRFELSPAIKSINKLREFIKEIRL